MRWFAFAYSSSFRIDGFHLFQIFLRLFLCHRYPTAYDSCPKSNSNIMVFKIRWLVCPSVNMPQGILQKQACMSNNRRKKLMIESVWINLYIWMVFSSRWIGQKYIMRGGHCEPSDSRGAFLKWLYLCRLVAFELTLILLDAELCQNSVF